ncbi:hypothetical protein BRADI_2g46107v3 [Brachypodium distachyon]|uniref:Uncharacterized protein n=1 Tax=Brachypodium distachyon TaxID=15368 RepID=A0A0Q3ITL3_BRADI|nr:hypothetical protein BRADI_2g46107v3 [Brachypodium distachyon]
MPGAGNEQVIIEDDNEGEEVLVTPTSQKSGSLNGKRVGSSGGGSPNKKNTPMQREFKRMVDHYTFDRSSVSSTSNATLTVEIESIMQKVVECGASEESPEYYMETKLFGKVENRVFFNTMKTKEGRLCWLTRMYEDRKRN